MHTRIQYPTIWALWIVPLQITTNPPYSVESSNKNNWIQGLMEDYKKEPGGKEKLQERNPKPINDDYVKFIRFCQHSISLSGNGILAFINPHGFISNPTFRGMRWQLMQTFSKIYIIDLHGNSNRQETCPDGSKDENVFDIQQGVCICIFVKNQASKEKCRVFHADLYGLRSKKYDLLSSSSLKSIRFDEIIPSNPTFQFIKVNMGLKNIYDEGFSVNDLFTLGNVGLLTSRDDLNFAFTEQELVDRLESFRHKDENIAREEFLLGKDVRDWKVKWAQNDVNENGLKNGIIDKSKIITVMYRPFDKRKMLYTSVSRGLICYPRSEITSQFICGNNFGFVTGRTNKSESCNHFFVVDIMTEYKCAERTTNSIIYPLYSYAHYGNDVKSNVNYDKRIVSKFSLKLGLKYAEGEVSNDCFNELDLFYYIYAILYSQKYRTKYETFLKADYPKIPYESNINRFRELTNLGHRLVQIHLMKDSSILRKDVDYIKEGGAQVDKVQFKNGKIYINKKSCFTGITEEIWNSEIGGYQVLSRWFKDRKGRILSDEEIEAYILIINIMYSTAEIMNKIDEIVDFN